MATEPEAASSLSSGSDSSSYSSPHQQIKKATKVNSRVSLSSSSTVPVTTNHIRIKAWTAGVTTAALFVLLLSDWENTAGSNNVFSSVRPRLKGALNTLYGVEQQSGPVLQAQQKD